MNYSLIRSILFTLDPESSHTITLKSLKLFDRINLLQYFIQKTISSRPINVLGLNFENPVGLAAGFDKNGDYIDCLSKLGFGFLEIGTVTPKPQSGNTKPRLFRLPQHNAIINRMGFNNKGVDYLVGRVKKKKYEGILGINIGKNAATPLESAIDDYIFAMRKVYQYASYITVNISSPNTPGLRNLQSGEYLSQLLKDLKNEQMQLANQYNNHVPLVIKVAPDLSHNEIVAMSHAFVEHKIDGVIATNTTIDREQIIHAKYANEAGGLSGQPLFDKATSVLEDFKIALGEYNIPIIASGGIMTAEQAQSKIAAGASLVQLYTGLIYSGPRLIFDCVRVLTK